MCPHNLTECKSMQAFFYLVVVLNAESAARNSRNAERLRNASVPPHAVVENAPARLPYSRHLFRLAPFKYSRRNPALKLSPAPIVSTTLTLTDGAAKRS